MAIFTPISTITQTTTPAEHQVRDVSQTLSLLDADIYPLDTMTRNLPAGPAAKMGVSIQFHYLIFVQGLPRLP